MDTQGLQYTAQLGECPDTAFQVVRFDLTESLSAPFELTLELASTDDAITAEQVLDRPATAMTSGPCPPASTGFPGAPCLPWTAHRLPG